MSGTRRVQRIVVVANPAAGQDEPVLATLNTAFARRRLDWDVAVTHGRGDGTRLANDAARSGADVVAAYGGDGTVMEVAAGLLGTDVPLAILPGGTANVLAADLGVPPALADAAELLVRRHALRPLDVGEAGAHHFVLRLAAGLEAEMDLRADRQRKDRLGVLAYPLSALEAAQTAPVARYRLSLDGEAVEAEGVSCVVANSGSFGIAGLTLAPDIDVSDGLFDVAVVTSTDASTLLAIAADIVAGRPPRETGVRRWKAREVRVDAEPRQHVVCDGEPAGSTPVTARVLPGAVKVVVPPSGTAASRTPGTGQRR